MRKFNKKYWPYQCSIKLDDTYPKFDNHLDWLMEQGACNKFVYFTYQGKTYFGFNDEDIMSLFLLRWS